MSRARNEDVEIYYETLPPDGDGEWLVFLPEAGLGAWTWAWTVDPIAGTTPHGAVVIDPRGTGRSGAGDPDPGPGAVDVGVLAADLEAVLADAGVERAAIVGHGLGGATALRYARTYGRARGLVPVATPASGAAVDRAALARLFGDDWPAVAFSERHRGRVPELREEVAGWRETDDAPPAARDALLDAYLAFDPEALYEVTTPALVLGPTASPVVPRAACERLAERLPRGAFEAVEGRHLAHAESAVAVGDRIVAFVGGGGADGADRA